MASIEERVNRLGRACNSLASDAALKAEIAGLKSDLDKLKTDLTWRLAGLQLAGLVAVAAIMGFLR